VGEKERDIPYELYDAYVRWAKVQEKKGDEILSMTKFGTELTRLRFIKKGSNGKEYRFGLRLKTSVELGVGPAQTEISMNYREKK